MIGGPRVVAGLDVGSMKTCAVLLELPGAWDEEDAPRLVGVGHARTEGMRHRSVTNIEAATEAVRAALREAEEMAGIEVEAVYAGLAGGHVEAGRSTGVVAVAGDEVTPRDVEGAHEVARAVVVPPDRELLHAIPQDYTVDGRSGVQDPVGMAATRLEVEVCLITASAAACSNLRRSIDRAGYGVAELVLAPLASNLAVLDDAQRQSGVVLVEIGAGSTEILAFREGRLRLVASLPFGAGTVSNDIVKGLGIPLDAAERLKVEYGAAQRKRILSPEEIELPGPTPGRTRKVSRDLLAHIIEQRLDEILGLVYEELESRGLLDVLPAGVVLTGGGAMLDGTVELAQEVFNMPISLGVPGGALGGITETARGPRHATAVGLALYGRMREEAAGGGPARRALSRVTDWLRDFF